MRFSPLALASGAALGFAGLVLAAAAVFAPGVELNPFQASPENPTVNLVTAVVLLAIGVFVLATRANARSAP